MLHILLLTSLMAQTAKPATPAPSQPASVAAASVVYLPPDAAALVVKISAAAESGRLCQSQLTAARDRLLTPEKQELDLQNQQADVVKERDTSADTVRRAPATSAESVAARNQNQAARTKWQNVQTQIGNTLQEQQRVKGDIATHLACLQASQAVLKGMFSTPSSAAK